MKPNLFKKKKKKNQKPKNRKLLMGRGEFAFKKMFHYLPENLYLKIAFPRLMVVFVPGSLINQGSIPLEREIIW